MGKNTRKKPIVYEGTEAELYKKIKNKWLRLVGVSVFLPLVLTVVVSFYNQSLNILQLFGNGEILLSLFSLTMPVLFDLFEAKQNNDEGIEEAFYMCTVIVCIQIMLYCMTRADVSQSKEVKSIIVSIIMVIVSWKICMNAVETMFRHSLAREGCEDNDN